MKNKIFIFLIIIAMLCGFVGGYFFKSLNNVMYNNIKITKDSYKKGWNDAKKRLEQRGISGTAGDNYYFKNVISGEIKKIDGKELYVKIIPFEILADPNLDIRKIKINNETKIIKIEKKSDNEYQKEINKFYKDNPKIKGGPDLPIKFPSLFKNNNAKIFDFKIGQKILIKASEEIVNKKSFIAEKITILYID